MFNEMVSYNAWCMNRCLPDGVTTPVPGPTTPKTQADCCNQLKLTLHGDAAANVGNPLLSGTTSSGLYFIWHVEVNAFIWPLVLYAFTWRSVIGSYFVH